MLKQGVMSASSLNPRGALPLTIVMALSIVNAWGRSRVWWKVMTALLTLIMLIPLADYYAALIY